MRRCLRSAPNADDDFVTPRSLYHLEKDADGNLVPLVNGKEGCVLECVYAFDNVLFK